jgi:hypothetical protein
VHLLDTDDDDVGVAYDEDIAEFFAWALPLWVAIAPEGEERAPAESQHECFGLVDGLLVHASLSQSGGGAGGAAIGHHETCGDSVRRVGQILDEVNGVTTRRRDDR